jgi:predicted DNA-binding transcriptional regulator YafY
VKEGWYWYLPKDAKFEVLPVTFTLEEAVSLYLAGRLLTQAQDERNQHMLSALTKLVTVMPKTIAPHQHALIDMLRERQKGQPDISGIFGVLALGWATHRIVRLRYTPPRRRTFECRFAPYLLEPSAIGRTIYALGHSTAPNGLRTYKLERIEFAEATDEVFALPPDFDGPALLKRAWGVMYGDEALIEVCLRFSHYVTRRVKETLWHPSQEIQDTPEGCIWTAQIGDTLEIENWIRGWGSDCEVLAPQDLRNKILQDVRRIARIYGIAFKEQVATDVLDEDMFNDFFGE